MTPYSTEFFEQQSEGSRRSAEQIVPLVMHLVDPRSVVDVGCGVGTWLAVFKDHGVPRILGIDGEYVRPEMLQVPRECFRPFDLTQPLLVDEKFDLAVSLEVGEHLPPDSARPLVESLTRLAPVVLFSAAIPHQHGVNHLNEQWPDYWRDHFAQFGYEVVDCIRKRVWSNPHLQYWYAQNVLLYVQRERLAKDPALARQHAATCPEQLSIVHPQHYLYATEWEHPRELAIQQLAQLLPPGEPFILVDEDQWAVDGQIDGRRCIPFTELQGKYNGPPEDDVQAIAELARLRAQGAVAIVFAWPAFWWLESYSGLRERLHSRYRRLLGNERIIVFDLHER